VHSKKSVAKLTLLHVDDSADDRTLVREAIALTNTPFHYEEADGLATAIAYFEFRNRRTRRLPALVILDYNLGTYTGVDFLHWLRFVKKMTSLPVVMLSGSEGRRHVAESYAAGANYFLNKPHKFEHLKLIIQSLHATVLFPSEPSPILLLNEYRPAPIETTA
jgi:two-component system response regulator